MTNIPLLLRQQLRTISARKESYRNTAENGLRWDRLTFVVGEVQQPTKRKRDETVVQFRYILLCSELKYPSSGSRIKSILRSDVVNFSSSLQKRISPLVFRVINIVISHLGHLSLGTHTHILHDAWYRIDDDMYHHSFLKTFSSYFFDNRFPFQGWIGSRSS